MYYRRKVILSLLQLFNGQLEKIRLQKLLFLFTLKQEKPEYDFIPYQYGCYSYSANADLTTMVKKGFLDETSTSFSKKHRINYLSQISDTDKKLMMEVKVQFGNMNADALMKYTYQTYPFYAINSLTARRILNDSEFRKVELSRPKKTKTILYTIGYEGISLEEYLNRLLLNDVKVLVDVRRNPLSMKYGFSKNQLLNKCQALGIEYIHMPEVGIPGELRMELNSQGDYDKLFQHYKKFNLPHSKTTQDKILQLLSKNKRIALTCFESNICQCHRKPLSEAITKLSTFTFEVIHI